MEYAIGNSNDVRTHDALASLRRFIARARKARDAGRELRNCTELELRKLMLLETELSNGLRERRDASARCFRDSGGSPGSGASAAPREWRDSGADSDHSLVGYAIRYESRTELLPGIFEEIASGACDEAIEDRSIVAAIGHDMNLLLGRVGANTLALKPDPRGVMVTITLPRSDIGWRAFVAAQRGDYAGQSFSFSTPDDVWTLLDSDAAVRRILHVPKIYDVGPCAMPAYPSTTITARSSERAPSSRHSGGDDLNFWRRRVRDNEKKTRRDPEVADWSARIRKSELALR